MTASKSEVRDPDRRMVLRNKLIGLAVMAPPIVLFGLFAVAEGIGLEPGWWGHLIQLALAVLVVAFAWVWPRVGGPLLLAAGTAVAVLILLPGGDLTMRLVPIVIVCAPIVVAGIFFTRAGRAERTPR